MGEVEVVNDGLKYFWIQQLAESFEDCCGVSKKA